MMITIYYIIDYAVICSLANRQNEQFNDLVFLGEVYPETLNLIGKNNFYAAAENFPGKLSFYFRDISLVKNCSYDVLAVTYLPKFLKRLNCPVFFFKADEQNWKTDFPEDLFIQSGYTGICQSDDLIIFDDQSKLLRVSDEEWMNAIIGEKMWAVRINEIDEALSIQHLATAREKALIGLQYEKMALIEKINNKQQEIEYYKRELLAYKLKNDFIEQFLHARNEKGEAAQIQQFYNRQYEVLPGWYKKFGHVIKFLTGKRE